MFIRKFQIFFCFLDACAKYLLVHIAHMICILLSTVDKNSHIFVITSIPEKLESSFTIKITFIRGNNFYYFILLYINTVFFSIAFGEDWVKLMQFWHSFSSLLCINRQCFGFSEINVCWANLLRNSDPKGTSFNPISSDAIESVSVQRFWIRNWTSRWWLHIQQVFDIFFMNGS